MSEQNENPPVEQRDPAYFQYYGMLTHQQNMLQDVVRTSTYRNAILNNSALFKDRLVLDVGAGSGILSYFAAQAGAKVYAVEASGMAEKMQKIVDEANKEDGTGKNAWMKDRIQVIQDKIESPDLPVPQVDTLISEPIGVLLVHERMLESFVYARDKYLKAGGAILPSQGSIELAPFTDFALWNETMGKVRFWQHSNFYGVDLRPLQEDARDEMFGMPVVGHFDPKSLMAMPTPGGFNVDFYTITLAQLREFTIPIYWQVKYTGIMHGIAGWFDLSFIPPVGTLNPVNIDMSTGPAAERTHWQQVRFLFKEPLAVNSNQVVKGWMKCVVNEMRSYYVSAHVALCDEGSNITPETIELIPSSLRRSGKWNLHEQTYNYSYMPEYAASQDIFRPESNFLYEPENEFVKLDVDQIPEEIMTLAEGVELPNLN
ncbi:S-adenosyl-L-methionine-dependent methyltransferase [Basidiobolus meristosporus CBS 931.73]|uniref:type I protein arginine methyltransferase n=1 Tax=Basidiobolus meristosporus CBS 931.73 TaxID=1314790 RepID=A0A1Y1XN35_9FUNG|nr:S-adenosyl-L-methionine-dependent methyltransferase [Basidiobolus meristosporus CBS 931.73]|eukprot:ORX87170.1 S-adenosyl-L-methionine-dependent methyltransferase [Basidiobolus meristosporus CBS 931.73]